MKEVMSAYNRYEGEPCCGSNRLLTQILRDEWGFDGIVVSDCWAVSDFWVKKRHETHRDAAHSSSFSFIIFTDLYFVFNYSILPLSVVQFLIILKQFYFPHL